MHPLLQASEDQPHLVGQLLPECECRCHCRALDGLQQSVVQGCNSASLLKSAEILGHNHNRQAGVFGHADALRGCVSWKVGNIQEEHIWDTSLLGHWSWASGAKSPILETAVV